MGSDDRSLALTWADIQSLCQTLPRRDVTGIYGVPTGGCIPAAILSSLWQTPLLDVPIAGCLVIDDICDSGKTLRPYKDQGFDTDALIRRDFSPQDLAPSAIIYKQWVKFPWEHETGAEDAIIRLLQFVGEDPTRDGLIETPKRVLKAFREMTVGYSQDPQQILSKRFVSTYDQVVVLKDIHFTSLCEHHLLPFLGKAHVGYIPNGPVVGLSKLARVVDCFSKRMQIQERLTQEIATAIQDALAPQAVGVVIEAHHMCMSCRGVGKKEGVMTTSVMLGAFRDDRAARQEFLSLITT